MKNWNRTGKIKAIILSIIFLPNLVLPSAITQVQIGDLIAPLILASLAFPLFMKLNKIIMGSDLSKPNWNDNPFNIKKPLIFFQFGAYFFLSVGLSMFIGTIIRFQRLNGFAVSSISCGIGGLIGIWLTLKWTKK